MGKTIKTQYFDDHAIVNNSIIVKIDELYNYYVIENHRYQDTAEKFNITKGMLTTLMNHYNLKKSKSLSHYWNRQTCLEKYGNENYNNLEQNKQTCLDRYGVDNQFKRADKVKEWHINAFGYAYPIQNPDINKRISDNWANKSKEELQEIQLKREEGCLKSLGVKSPMQHPEVAKKNASAPGKYEKVWKTKKKNGTTNTSKPEDEFYNFLINLFTKSDIERNYKSEIYPYHCDFYIKSIDTYIELNLFWTHMKHPFNGNEEDLKLLEELKLKSDGKNQYQSAIDVWTKTDVDKMNIAKNNNLNYYFAYNDDEINLIKERLYEIKSSY